MLNIYEAELCRRNLLEYTKGTMPRFSPNWFHESYYEVLNKFAKGEIKKLMVFVPPQHGKSEGSTRRLPTYMIGNNHDLKIAIASYSDSKAKKFNREIRRIMLDEPYKDVFPQLKLSNGADGYSLTMNEIEVVGHEGGIKTVGVGGALTGEPVDILIIDDIYKDAEQAWSENYREKVKDWYNTVGDSRLHNDSQILIVFTRWHEQDLAGYLLGLEDDWDVVKFEAIKTGAPTDIDPRKEGEALWPERHNVEKLNKIKLRDPHVWESLYQGDPKAKEGLLYKDFKTYKTLPDNARRVKAVVDTADTGSDYLCSIVYVPTVTGYYIIDILYSSEGMEVTEQENARQLAKHGVNSCKVESNNGGRTYARNVERLCRELGNTMTSFTWFHQSKNKEVRIFTRAADVQNMIYYPEGWETMFPKFANTVKGYMAKGKNKHDDAPDALTMIIEEEQSSDYVMTYV